MMLFFLKKATTALALMGFSYAAHCQPIDPPLSVCATPEHALPWLRAFQQNAVISPRTNETLYVPVVLHIVGTDDNKGHIAESKVLDAFCSLNQHFRQAGIQFFLNAPIRRIASSYFNDHRSVSTAISMMNMHNVPGAVNTYFVDNAADACGYTLRDNSGLGIGIALSEECLGPNTTTWTHEMGHFFSLPHTFKGWERETLNWSLSAPARAGGVTVEYADGRNCAVAGDGFCDTPADYLNGRWFCSAQAQSQIVQLDPSGQPFRSDGSLFMSYSADPCASRFSPMQQNAMRAYLKGVRVDLIRPFPDSVNLTLRSEIQLLQPSNASNVQTFQEVLVSWKRVSEATGYLVEFSFLPSFPFLTNSYLTQDTALLLQDLKPSKTYFWRIRPFSMFSTCKVYSKSQQFSTGAVTNLGQINAGHPDLTLFPNPARTNQPLSLKFSSEKPGKMEFQLFDLTGRITNSGSWEINSGENLMYLDRLPDQQGTFLLRLRLEGATISRKIFIGP